MVDSGPAAIEAPESQPEPAPEPTPAPAVESPAPPPVAPEPAAPKAGLLKRLFHVSDEPAKPEPTPEAAPAARPPPPPPAAQDWQIHDQPVDWESPEVRRGLFKRLSERLSRSRTQLGSGLGTLFLGRKKIDDELMEELETLLLTADVGVEATSRVIDDLTRRVKRKALADPQALLVALKGALRPILTAAQTPVRQAAPDRPQVILMVGVNGAGKTTTIGKLARVLQAEGNSVMLAAGDTFRAAAVEQLQTWGERNRVPVIAQKGGADSASVIFDALQAATARGVDVLIADTAGRLHTKTNLMDELSKIARVMKKLDPEAPHEVLLVVDATTGQNGLNQAVQFHQAIPLTGIALTKLDGTAKGGIVFAIAEKLKVPIRFIGVGESIEDLRPFDADEFLDALLGQ
ncbi:signal recognition particle-docking protein FtsY [uncultured Thiodictyon sp.]|uniref:signal recognition particle-docking protein FtsY n=1 Tax=uncultured Thiodictyon sp. TaxID=1846217 RepID=UPI0025F13E61|nr:signal recognition particle-docking protein FtsY [uncultured Thiodictyon sp.]